MDAPDPAPLHRERLHRLPFQGERAETPSRQALADEAETKDVSPPGEPLDYFEEHIVGQIGQEAVLEVNQFQIFLPLTN